MFVIKVVLIFKERIETKMIHQKILLSEYFDCLKKSNSKAVLRTYIPDNSEEKSIDRKRPAVLIFPGGGYAFTSPREAEPVAIKFVNAGFNAFILDYSVAPTRYPAQLLEASAALSLIRQKSDEWNTVSDKIAVCGFSAGGHLAASIGTMWQEKFIAETLGTEYGENRPNAMILCYPVITGLKKAHRGSFDNLLGENADENMVKYLSLENRVTSLCPPAFLWHTFDDNAVPVKNSLLMANALEENNIMFEMHIYDSGVHGLSLCSEETASSPEHINPHAASWIKLCTEWLYKLFDFKA